MAEFNLPHNHGTHKSSVKKFKNHLSAHSFSTASEKFKVLGDSSRLQIYWLLCHCEECVSNIASLCAMSGPAVCHHLKILKENGFVTCRKDGKEVYYKAAETNTGKLFHKTLEDALSIPCPQNDEEEPYNKTTDKYTAEQIETIKRIHDYLVFNLDKKITIEDLSKEFLMNTTTLKEAFKAVWGTSVAAHIKEHKMKKSAELLKETDMNISEICAAVGYNTPSKFTEAFKKFYGTTPKTYRKNT